MKTLPKTKLSLLLAAALAMPGVSLADYILRVPSQMGAPAAPAAPELSVFGLDGNPLGGAVDFGTVSIGATAGSASGVAWVKNTGTAAAELTGAGVSGDASFTQGAGASSCADAASLAPNQSCTVYVSFAPTSVGGASGSFSLGATQGLPATIQLSGNGEGAPWLELRDTYAGAAQSTIAAPAATLNAGATTVTAYLFNTGNLPVAFGATPVSVNAPFSVASHTCASQLNPGNACTATLSFAPTTAGTFTSPITISSNVTGLGALSVTGTATAPITGQSLFTTPGTYSWVVPEGVYSVSVVAVGAGGGGAGNGGDSVFGSWVQAGGGKKGTTSVIGAGGTVIAGTGYAGGAGEGGGGGAGGYAGAGGKGGVSTNGYWGGAGGGVGLYGQGANGSGGYSSGFSGLAGAGGAGGGGGGGHGNAGNGNGGNGGSGGGGGGKASGSYPSYTGGVGGLYGGGGGGGSDGSSSYKGHGGGALAYANNIAVTPGQTVTVTVGAGGANGGAGGGAGGKGAVRIVWPGDTRAFPSTNVATP